MIVSTSRKEDMSVDGYLKVSIDDGDIYVAVYEDEYGEGISNMACVEFCNIGIGGGHSPKTMETLKNLINAMKEDNEKFPSRSRD